MQHISTHLLFFPSFSCIIQIALTKWRGDNGYNKLFIDDNLKFTRPSRFDDECTFVRWIYIYMIYPYSYGSHSDTSFWKRSCHAYTCEIIHTLSVPSFLRRVKVGFQGFAEAFPSWLRSMERIMHVRSTWMSTDQLAVLKRLNSPSQWQTDARYLRYTELLRPLIVDEDSIRTLRSWASGSWRILKKLFEHKYIP